LVSSSATVTSAPAAVLELSIPQSPVVSAGDFSYTLAYPQSSKYDRPPRAAGGGSGVA
jgi:hypothetical protein